MTRDVAPPPAAAPVSGLEPLRVPAYRRLLAGTLVSALGLFLHAVAASWVMLELTGSPFLVSMVTAAAFLPRLVSGIPAGAVADIVDRRTILVWSNVVNAALALLLAWLQFRGALTAGLLITISFGLGFGGSLSLPAYHAIIPDLLPRRLVSAAASLQSGGFNVARAVGPAVGGLLVAADLADLAFALNGVSYLAIALAVITLRGDGFRRDDPEPLLRALATGLRYVRHTPLLLRIIAVTALFAVASGSVQPLLPNIARDALQLGARGYGILFACFGGGALVGAVLRERASTWLPRRMIPVAIVGFGTAGVLFGLSRQPVLSGALLAFVGAFWVWTLATLNATVQLSSPGWVRGRAMGIYLLAFTGLYPLGALSAGAVAEAIGAASTVALFSTAAVVIGLSTRRLVLPALEDLVGPSMPDDWSAQPHAAVRVHGAPVVVVTEWEIDPAELDGFFTVMRQVRRHRYRSGAVRWVLLRNAEHPRRMTEVFEVPDWEEHLRQHARLDAEAVEALRRARGFDRAGGPHTRHLVGIDLLDPAGPPGWDQLLAVHAGLHQQDGSVPLDREEVLRVARADGGVSRPDRSAGERPA